VRKALQRQKSIEKKKLYEEELDGLMKLGKPKAVENRDDVSSIDAERFSDAKLDEEDEEFMAQAVSKSVGGEDEEASGEVYTENCLKVNREALKGRRFSWSTKSSAQ